MATRRKSKPGVSDAIDEAISAVLAKLKSPSNSQRKKALRVTALAAEVVARAAQTRPLSEEEERQLKTRLQYRLYQRNHRAKKQRKTEDLDEQVHALHDQVAGLEAARLTLTRQFVRGAMDRFVSALRSATAFREPFGGVLVEDAALYARVVAPWRIIEEGFDQWRVQLGDKMALARTESEHALVVASVPVQLLLYGSAAQFEAIFPSGGDETLPSAASSRLAAMLPFKINGRCVVGVTRSGRIESLAIDLDLVQALADALEQPLRHVSRLAARCKLPFCGYHPLKHPVAGGRGAEQEDGAMSEGSDRDSTSSSRLSMTFLLG